jgi:hypothetical protein
VWHVQLVVKSALVPQSAKFVDPDLLSFQMEHAFNAQRAAVYARVTELWNVRAAEQALSLSALH